MVYLLYPRVFDSAKGVFLFFRADSKLMTFPFGMKIENVFGWMIDVFRGTNDLNPFFGFLVLFILNASAG